MRVVQMMPRVYKEEIDFAVEKLFLDKQYEKKGKFKDQMFKVFKIDRNLAKGIIFKESNLDIKQSISVKHKYNVYG